MKLSREIRALRRTFVPWLACLFVLTIFFFAFGVKRIEIKDIGLYLPWPAFKSIAVMVLGVMKQGLVPQEVSLVTLNPMNAFLAQIEVAFFLGFLVSFPLFLWRLIRYVAPALHERERSVGLKVLLPSFVLFGGGCVFAYFLLIPSTFNILYTFAERVGAEPFFVVNGFVMLTLGLMLVTGIVFLLPIFMALLSRLGLVDKRFWRRNWRYAVVAFLILSAFITPDGTGITMLMLMLPLVLLYFLGVALAGERS